MLDLTHSDPIGGAEVLRNRYEAECVARKRVEIRIGMKYRDIDTYGHRRDKAVNEFAHRCAVFPAGPIQCGRMFVVARDGRNEGSAREQASQVVQVPLIPRASQNLHAHRIASGDVAIE